MKIRKLSRCPSAKYSFVITVQAHKMFETMDQLRAMLGDEQHQPEGTNATNPRPWYFVFTKDSTSGAWRNSDGSVDLRLYINDEDIAVQFKLMCGDK